jgi:outer membrane protein OmpA-like peptidoglycan-associated protein
LKRVVQRSVWGAKVIYFDYDSFVIKAESRTLLEAHARQYGLTRIAAFQLKAMLTNEVAASTALL